MTKASRVPVFILLLSVLLVMVTGCAPVYVPNAVHTPMLEERGDVQVGGRVGAFGGTRGLDLQAAYAVTDKVGVSADFSHGDEQPDDPDFHLHQFGEMGIGYFNDISSFAQFEVYGGYGRGQAESEDTYTFFTTETIRAKGRYDRLFLQPALQVKGGPLHLYGAARLVRVNFHEFVSTEDSGPTRTVSDIQPVYFNEMAVGLGLGTGPFRIGLQSGISAPLSDPEDIEFDTQSVWISLGAQFRFNVLD